MIHPFHASIDEILMFKSRNFQDGWRAECHCLNTVDGS